MQKSEYLTKPIVNDFQSWIKPKIDSYKDFSHMYVDRRTNKIWTCQSIFEAHEKYSWQFTCSMPDGQIISGSTYLQNSKVLQELDIQLKKSVDYNNQTLAKSVSFSILDWGGVLGNDTRGNKQRVNSCINYVEYLNRVKDAMENENFDLNSDFTWLTHMNSGFSKIYSILVNNLIIYDSRVGAALGFLVRKYLKDRRFTIIPQELDFSYSNGRAINNGIEYRNPSNAEFVFKKFDSNSKRHIRDTIKASWLVNSIAENTRFSKGPIQSNHDSPGRRLESALFMIGYDVRQVTYDTI
jgi:hypothetical protein